MCIHYKQRQTERIANFFFFSQWEKFNKKKKKSEKKSATHKNIITIYKLIFENYIL